MAHIHLRRTKHMSDLRRYWKVMSLSERFEQVVAAVLGVIVAIVILLALWELLRLVVDTLILQHQNVLDHGVFQKLFGAILTLLIAMEFQHSIIQGTPGRIGDISAGSPRVQMQGAVRGEWQSPS